MTKQKLIEILVKNGYDFMEIIDNKILMRKDNEDISIEFIEHKDNLTNN